MSWPKEDLFAVTVDGKVLMNARCLDDVDLAELAKRKTGVFIGVVLTRGEVRELLVRMYDASAETAAFFSGKRRRRVPRRSRRRST